VPLGLALLGVSAAPRPAEAGTAAEVFRSVVAAWQAGSAERVVAQVAGEGRLALELLNPPVKGSFEKAQAQKTLAGYFERVSGPVLKDVTPADRPPTPGRDVRLYDYRYLPRGRDEVTTRLAVTVKGDGRGGWMLDAIQETPRPQGGR
jgi:hypothetical protein